MKFKSTVIAASVLAGIMSLSAGAYAMGGASGAHVNYPTTGKIGAVMMNPYGIAPLTAVICNGGYSLSDISVRIVPKDGGQEITYTASDAKARTHGGIPIFGLYAGYRNTGDHSPA
ncbi:aryl-sulfate sulfotransferase N-terminal domain-containing protein [Sutterella wadsworthensis]|uniref:aryl-sulfate sulfotransferase N-terminal domain-containing protein n=1 Tax=Sutterella wadsworthensis TaxID=40545 RepID=UPI0039670CC4